MRKRLTKGGLRRALEEEKERLEEGCVFITDEDSFEDLLHWIDLRSSIDCFPLEWKGTVLEVCFDEAVASTAAVTEAVASTAAVNKKTSTQQQTSLPAPPLEARSQHHD